MSTRRYQLPDDFDQTIFDHLPSEELSSLSKHLNHDQLLIEIINLERKILEFSVLNLNKD